MKKDYVKPETLIVQLRFKRETLWPAVSGGGTGGKLSRGIGFEEEEPEPSSNLWER